LDQIFGFDPQTLEKTMHTGCFPLHSSSSVALGSRWFAYPGNSLVPQHSNENSTFTPGFTEIGVGVAKKAYNGISYLGDLGAKVVSNYVTKEGTIDKEEEKELDQTHAGTVIIKDVQNKRVIAHFKAHSQTISFLKFDPSGTLLVTSSVEGNYLNIYQILPSMEGELNSRPFQQLYRLYRGLTTATIRDVQFSINSKWIVVSSAHGTSRKKRFFFKNKTFMQSTQQEDL
jgi:WD40 repeat protein